MPPPPTHVIEPIRKTFYNVIQDNFNIANRVTYVHRLIYVGEHTFSENPGHTIADGMESTITTVNDGYTDERLTGILVCYPKYFCHIIEGSEESIHKHLVILLKRFKKYLARMKVLVCYHHINQRFIGIWMSVSGKPPSLLEKIDLNCDISRTGRYVYNCVQKLYKLAIYERHQLSYVSLVEEEESLKSTDSDAESIGQPEKLKNKEQKVEDKLPAKGDIVSQQGTELTYDTKSEATTDASKSEAPTEGDDAGEGGDKERGGGEIVEPDIVPEAIPAQPEKEIENFVDLLPEYGLIEFLLSTSHVQDLYRYISIYNEVTHIESFKDKVWPIPTDFIPMNVFEEARDPATDLPVSAEVVQETIDISEVPE